ncbi:MAG TPA: YggS family pyridoxal phosphate-dependent enzyme [Firmicutes bacterium]|nr:YggS family pyridoxal phosphate-dependent enzyme [Candidatus Fermentithermobacillaceae bacterium]
MIEANLEWVLERVRKACERSGRDPGAVRVMAVTKSQEASLIREARDAGIALFGENRVQEARKKVSEGLFDDVCLCMIGHLQTNKASMAARIFDEVHSVDSERVASALAKYAAMYRKGPLPILIEVNAGRDPRKHGVAPEGALQLARYVMSLPSLRLKGLMTVAPASGEAEARMCFRSLRMLRDDMVGAGIDPENLRELSMGMSGDFDIAVEEGATIIRLGTILFGPRS